MPIYIEAAGCTNTCRHCARGGRPPFGALYSLDELRELADEWGPFVVDCEPTAHPDFPETMDPAVAIFEGGVLATNGFGLARAGESGDAFVRLRDFGYGGVSLTLHGLEQHHDWFVRRQGAYQDILAASGRAQEAGFGVHWNVFLDNRNLEDVPRLVALKGEQFGDSVSIGLPQHTVSRRMWRYERLRPSARDIRERLPQVQALDPAHWQAPLEQRTEAGWMDLWGDEPGTGKFADPWEPNSWPPVDPIDSLVLFLARDRQVYLDPLCASHIPLGRLDEGRAVIEERVRGLPAPHDDIDAETAERRLGRRDLLHPTGASVRYKAISTAIHGEGPGGTALA